VGSGPRVAGRAENASGSTLRLWIARHRLSPVSDDGPGHGRSHPRRARDRQNSLASPLGEAKLLSQGRRILHKSDKKSTETEARSGILDNASGASPLRRLQRSLEPPLDAFVARVL